MKKYLAILLAILCVCGIFAGCAKKETPKNLDLNEVYNAIVEAQGDHAEELYLFEETDTTYIDGCYEGLSEIPYKQLSVHTAFVTGAATEVVLIEVENSADVDKVKEIFQARIDLACDDTFYADTAAQWKDNAQIQSSGNYVAMVVLYDPFVVPDDVFSLVK